jgi:PKD repeat protein
LCTDLSCTFNAAASFDSDGTIVSYDWDLGDGNIATGISPSHTYGADGTYIVTLTVTDDAGAVASVSQEVTVAAVVTNQPPVASFTSNCTDLTCTFTSTSTDDGTIVSYAWDFGDGGTAAVATATHIYAAAGTYSVTLTVTDDLAATGTITQDVTVTAPAPAPAPGPGPGPRRGR